MKKIFLLIFLSLFFFRIYGQIKKGEGALFIRPNQTNHIPLDISTGAVSVSIPLYTANSGDLTVPIFLSYVSNGERVMQYDNWKILRIPSEVGLGWNLVAGGKITSSYLPNFKAYDYNTISTINNDNLSLDFMNNVNNGRINVNPSVIRISAPGLSASFFVVEENNKKSFIPADLKYSNIKVEVISDAYYEPQLKVTNEDGTGYYFEKSTYLFADPKENVCSAIDFFSADFEWLLTKIVNSNKTDSIVLKYTQVIDPYSEDSVYYHTVYGDILSAKTFTKDSGSNSNSVEKYQAMLKKCSFIKSITTNNEKIVFNTKALDIHYNHSTVYNGTYALDYDSVISEIIIFDKNGDLKKKYTLNYNDGKRLTELEETYPDDELTTSYRFNYYQCNKHASIDFWGFRKKIQPGCICSNEIRFPDENAISGMLKEVQYPNGGYTRYEYEPNTYNMTKQGWSDSVWEAILSENGYTDLGNLVGPGVRLKKVTTYDSHNEIIKQKEFSYLDDEGNSSGRLTEYPRLQIRYHIWIDNNKRYRTLKNSNSFGTKMGYVFYTKVTVYDGGKKSGNADEGKNGKTIYYFSDTPPTQNDDNTDDDFPYPLKVFNGRTNKLLDSILIFDSNNRLKTKQINIYNKDNFKTDFYLITLKLLVKDQEIIPQQCPPEINDYYKGFYRTYQTNVKLIGKKQITYDANGNSIEDLTEYSYERGNKKYNRPVTIRETSSTGDSIRIELKYPEDMSGEVFDKMLERNIYSPIIQKEVFKNGEKISGIKTDYSFKITNSDTLILPSVSYRYENGKYVPKLWFDAYDEYGNLVESHGVDGVHTSMIYGYDGTLPIATVTNATSKEIFHTDFENGDTAQLKSGYTGNYCIETSQLNNYFACSHDFKFQDLVSPQYVFSAWFNTNTNGAKLIVKSYPDQAVWLSKDIPNTNGQWKYFELIVNKADLPPFKDIRCEIWGNGKNVLVDNVRFLPTDAYMTTTTYEPLVGVLSETDANNFSVFNEYDQRGRIIKQKDQDKVVIKEYKYNIPKRPEINFSIVHYPDTIIYGCPITFEANIEGTLPSKGELSRIFWYFNIDEDPVAVGRVVTFDSIPTNIIYCRIFSNGFFTDSQSVEVIKTNPTVNLPFPTYEIQYFLGNGQTKTFSFNTDGCRDYHCSYGVDWLNCEVANDTKTITITAFPNESDTVRETTVSFNDNFKPFIEIKIAQIPIPDFSISIVDSAHVKTAEIVDLNISDEYIDSIEWRVNDGINEYTDTGDASAKFYKIPASIQGNFTIYCTIYTIDGNSVERNETVVEQ